MRKRIWLVVLFLAVILIVTLGAASVFAQEPVVSGGEGWEEMHQACENGDYEAMAQWHTQCQGQGNVTDGDMMGDGMMGDGMMGSGMMGNW